MRATYVLLSAAVLMTACDSNEEDTLSGEVDSLARQVAVLQEQIAVCTALVGDSAEDSASILEVVQAQQEQIEENTWAIQEVTTSLSQAFSQMDGVEEQLERMDTRVSMVQGKSIDTPTVWTVGGSPFDVYSSLTEAMEAARSVTIHPKGSLSIQVAPGVYSHTETLSLNHPDGERITIEGVPEDPGAVVLEFKGSMSASVHLSDGHSLAGFHGFTLRGDGVSTTNGLVVDWGALGTMGDLIVESFASNGIMAGRNATLSLDPDSVVVRENGGHGIKAYYGALIYAPGVVSEDNRYSGVIASLGAIAVVKNGRFENNDHSGALAHYDALTVAHNSTSQYNGAYGFYAYGNSMLYALSLDGDRTVSANNGSDGFFSHSSMIRGNGARIHNNNGYGARLSYQGYLDIRDFTGNGGKSGVSWTGGLSDINASLLR